MDKFVCMTCTRSGNINVHVDTEMFGVISVDFCVFYTINSGTCKMCLLPLYIFSNHYDVQRRFFCHLLVIEMFKKAFMFGKKYDTNGCTE